MLGKGRASARGRGRTPEGAARFGNRQTQTAAPDEREGGGACVNLTEEGPVLL